MLLDDWSVRVCSVGHPRHQLSALSISFTHLERVCLHSEWSGLERHDLAVCARHVLRLEIFEWSQLWNSIIISGQSKPHDHTIGYQTSDSASNS